MVALLHDPSVQVRLAAARAVAELDSRDERQAVIELVRELTESLSADDRVLGAQMLTGLRPADGLDATSLDRLLNDDDPAVVQHALGAVIIPAHLDAVLALLARRATATAALEALVRGVKVRWPRSTPVSFASRLLSPRASLELAKRDPRVQALAFEWFDVTLEGADRLAMGLIDPQLSDELRLRSIGRFHEGQFASPQDWLREVAEDVDGFWSQPWISSCAVAAARSSFPELRLVLDHWSNRTGGEIVFETEQGLRARAS